MSHALSMLCWRLFGRLVFVLTVGALIGSDALAYTAVDKGTGDTATSAHVTASVSYDYTTHILSYSYNVGPGVMGFAHGAFAYITTGNHGPISGSGTTVVFDVNPVPGGAGSGTKTSVAEGVWVAITARERVSGDYVDWTWYYLTPTAPPTDKKIKMNITNTRDYAMKYILTDRATGTVIASHISNPGEVNYSWVVTVTGFDGPYDLSLFVPSKLVDGVWEEADLEDGDNLPVMPDVPSHTVPTTDDPVDVTPVQPPDKAPTGTTNISKTIWSTTTANTVDNDRLDKATYKQGVDKIVAAIDPLDKSLKKLVAHNDADDAAKESAATAADAAKSTGESSGASAGVAVSALYDAVSSNSQGYTIPDSGAAPSALAVTLPASFGGKTFQLNPFTSDRMGPLASWFRSAVKWLALTVLGAWLWSQVGGWTRGFSTMRQATGNAVVGGTGAQGTALIAAGLMTVAVVVAVTALLGWAFGEITFPALVTVMHTNPITAMPADAYWMVDQLLPVATLIGCLCARLSFNMYASSLFAACSAVVRYIVP